MKDDPWLTFGRSAQAPLPKDKGIRDPGQSAVMGGQNAKNYVADCLAPRPEFSARRDYKATDSGRWEWLHLIGSSLGGPNVADNLVAGSYDANTKMIALEHRVALWGARGYDKEFMPTEKTPISIVTSATVGPQTVGTEPSHLARKIITQVLHGDREVLKGDYDADDQRVITKSEYDEEQRRVNAEVERNRKPAPTASSDHSAIPQVNGDDL